MRLRYSLAALLLLYAPWSKTFPDRVGQMNPPIVRSQSTVVQVPTFVRSKSGAVVHGLVASDFVVEEDGVEQPAKLDQSPDIEPLSIVIAVETGGAARGLLPAPADEKKLASKAPLSGLGTMLEAFVGEAKADVAIVSFDSHVYLAQNFSDDVSGAVERLDKLSPGDEGAAILDAVSYSLDLLNHHRTNRSNVLILVSETRDQGSHIAKIADIIQQVGLGNTLVYSLAFSATRIEFMHDLHQKPMRNSDPNILAPLMIVANSMRKNTASAVASLTGGEYATFASARSLDEQMEAFAGDERDRYLLTFQATNAKPGPHNIRVRLRNPQPGSIVSARTLYWSVAGDTQP